MMITSFWFRNATASAFALSLSRGAGTATRSVPAGPTKPERAIRWPIVIYWERAMTFRTLLRGTAAAGTLAATLAAAPSAEAAISIDSPGGDTSASSFTWQGLNFTLDNQPGSAVNAPHRVEGTSSGAIDFFLEEPGKVSYRAELPTFEDNPTAYSLGFRYGEDLSASTPAFSNMTGFYRRIDDGTEIVQQMLAGSDAGNSDSVFYGTTGRTAAGGSMSNQKFLTNLGFGVDGLLEMVVSPDGTAETSVFADGVAGSADFSVDLTPDGVPSTFTFAELILQAESFQDDTSFADQFGETGQKFTFTSADVSEVPVPDRKSVV